MSTFTFRQIRNSEFFPGSSSYELLFAGFKIINPQLSRDTFEHYFGPDFKKAYISYTGSSELPSSAYMTIFYKKGRKNVARTAVGIRSEYRGKLSFQFHIFAIHCFRFYLRSFCRSFKISIQIISPLVYRKLALNTNMAEKPSKEEKARLASYESVEEIIREGLLNIQKFGYPPFVVEGSFSVPLSAKLHKQLMQTDDVYLRYFIYNIPTFGEGLKGILTVIDIAPKTFIRYALRRFYKK